MDKTEQHDTRSILLEGGPLNGQRLEVYTFQTTASVNIGKLVVTYRKCGDGVWRYVPAMDETAGDD